MSTDVERANEQFRAWMRANLDRAAADFSLTLTEVPVFGWRLRSISAAAQGRYGPCWLRVVTESPQWLPADFWTGNIDANAITGVNKPRVLDTTEWDEQDWWRRVRAEVMTRMSSRPCSPTDVLHGPITLPDVWWTELRRTLEVLKATPTHRVAADQDKVTGRIQAVFGDRIDPHVHQWETVHGDLHWSNLLQPEFGVLDWEFWGRGPAGLDPATLYCYSLMVPPVSQTVHAMFSDILDSHHGRIAQLYAVARLIKRAESGDHPELEQPLRDHAAQLLGR